MSELFILCLVGAVLVMAFGVVGCASYQGHEYKPDCILQFSNSGIICTHGVNP